MTDQPADPTRALDDAVAACAASHQRLHATLERALEAGALDPRAPSKLPGWSVGHVLTHLARNADALRGMVEGATVGEQRLMYPDQEARNADIEAGSGRPTPALIDDLRRASWALESSWARLDAAAWAGAGRSWIGVMPVAHFPWRRQREVEVHRADLGLPGEGPETWDPAWVAADLRRRLADRGGELPEAVAAAEPWRRLAWLFGRDAGPGLPPSPPF